MKRFITMLFVLLIPAMLSASVFTVIEAGSSMKESFNILSADDPRDDLLERNLSQITIAEDTQVKELYRDEKLSLWGPAARALCIGFGSGAKAIGDTRGEVIGAWGDGIGLGSALVGGLILGIDWFGVSVITSINEPNADYEMSGFGRAGRTMIISGGAIMAASRIFDTARVFFWGSGYNRRLKSLLEEYTAVSITPDTRIEAALNFSW